MNKEQAKKVNMIDASVVVLNAPANKALWITNTTFSAAVASIATNLGALNSNDALRMTGSSPITETKSQAKTILIAATMLHAAAGKGYATSVNNVALKTICDISENSLQRSKDADLGSACTAIYNAVQPFIGSMAAWTVNATTLATLQADITAFVTLVGAPVGQISMQNAASEAIDAQIAIIDGILNNTIDTLMVQFKTAHAVFYNGYFNAREMHNTGVRHSTTFSGFIYKTGGAALDNAKVELSEGGAVARHHFTDTTGHYRFTRLHLGTFTLTVSETGYVTQTKNFTVAALQDIETDFTMVASGGGGTTNPTPAPGTQ